MPRFASMLVLLCMMSGNVWAQERAARPNVVLIMTDDQGYGDLGAHGNPKIKTPNLDRFAGESGTFTHFYVSPVCTPTRASLMTGRYNYRTGAIDTFMGRAMMHADEVTVAERLREGGYRTGIFGKWHLGDNHPMRAMDQGFEESLVHRGGGIGQPSDPPGGDHYMNPTLLHNGRAVKTEGYCSDIYTNAAMSYIEEHRAEPFFVYLAFNAPHTPLEVPDEWVDPYRKMNLDARGFPAGGNPIGEQYDREVTARIYAMVENIDSNVGKLLAKLDELKLSENTIVIFMTDNGPQQERFKAGLRDRKGSVHEGGIRVPYYVRWPGKIEAERKIDRIAAHIDVTPTLLDACGIAIDGSEVDGRSLLPLLRGERVRWRNRTLFFQWHRGDEPELGRAFAARSQRWKLVQPLGAHAKAATETPLMLFDMAADPFELRDVASEHPDVVERMWDEYQRWFRGVSETRGYDPPRIRIGTREENPVMLTRQDRRGAQEGRATGGNSGIGLGFAEGLAQAGAAVCIWGTNPTKNAAAVEQLKRHGRPVHSFVVDVGDQASVKEAFRETVAAMGGVDSCFANAGVGGRGTPFLDMSLEEWRAVFRVNMEGVFFTFQEAIRHMVERGGGGSLVATSSGSTIFGAPRSEHYAATKGGLLAMVKGLAVEHARHGIRANAVLPGWIDTAMTEKAVNSPVFQEKVLKRIPHRRWGQPDDFSGIAVYLASDASSFHTGDAINIDGGYACF